MKGTEMPMVTGGGSKALSGLSGLGAASRAGAGLGPAAGQPGQWHHDGVRPFQLRPLPCRPPSRPLAALPRPPVTL